MALASFAGEPASLACLARGPPGRGLSLAAGGREVSLRILGSLSSEPLFVYPTSLDATVADVKEAIARIEGTPPRQQRLVAGGRRFCGDSAGGSADHLSLREVLGDALAEDPWGVAAVDVALVRLPAAWAELLEGLQKGGVQLKRLDAAARSDRELVLAAISRDGSDLAHAAEELRADRSVVAAAVRRDPLALRFAAPELRDDREIVLAAVRSCGQALQHTSEARRRDREVVLAAMSSSWRSLEHASPELRSDPEFVLAAVQEHGSALLFAAPELKSDREIVMAAVKRSGWALSCASEELKRDRACVLAAVTSNPAALDFAVESLRGDPEVAALVANASGRRIAAPCGQGPPPCAVL